MPPLLNGSGRKKQNAAVQFPGKFILDRWFCFESYIKNIQNNNSVVGESLVSKLMAS
jgi:hypothetical protein